MTRERLRGSFWPTPRQQLTLRVIGADEADVADAWDQLRPQLDLERLELGSFSLMPLLYRRLENIAPADALVAKLAGIYRKTWYTNQLELSRVAPALVALVEAGGDPLVINGWELVFGHYRDRGVRPVAGLDVLISARRFARAERALSASGWKLDAPAAPRLPQRVCSMRFLRNGASCVLHRELFPEFPVRDASAMSSVWDTAAALRVDDVEAGMLAPGDEFLSICLKGARARNWPDVQWLADALQVARASDFDWSQVVARARLLGATLRLHSALVYMRDSLSFAAPAEVFSEIEQVEANRRERLAHALGAWRGGALGLAPESVTRYLRATANEGGVRAASRLPSFLRDEWGLRHRRTVPLVAAAKAARRILFTAGHVIGRPRPEQLPDRRLARSDDGGTHVG